MRQTESRNIFQPWHWPLIIFVLTVIATTILTWVVDCPFDPVSPTIICVFIMLSIPWVMDRPKLRSI